jgi:hypothetical protein
MKFTFFKIPIHRQFHYSPLYFDEAKEEREERERRIRKELGISPVEGEKESSYSDRIRGKMNRRIKTNFEVTRKAKKTSNLRLLAILIALFALFSYLLKASHEWYERFF